MVLSTRPADHTIGTEEEWKSAEEQLKSALNSSGREWSINEGDGAFYGPKIDIILKDSNGKEHQTATIQLDFQLPQRFDLQYQASLEELESQKERQEGVREGMLRPVIIHRAIYGSLERFMALLMEHYDGNWPFWLAPRQAIILSVNQNPEVLDHVAEIQKTLSLGTSSATEGDQAPLPLDRILLNVDIDTSANSLKSKIVDARSKRYNHIIVVGVEEAKNKTMCLGFGSQPQKKKAEVLLKHHSGVELTKRQEAIIPAEVARKYMEDLVRKYL